MARGPTVSVIMPVRNSRQYVEKAAKSILEQSYSSFEFIIIDDQSEDGTSELLRKLANGDSRIIVIRNQKWQGVTRSLNIGLSRAQGEFIARQDADDWSAVTRFERQFAYLQAYPDLALTGTWVTKVDHEGAFLKIKEWPTEPDQIKEGLYRKNVITHGSILGRRELFCRCGGYREGFEVSQDRDLWLRAVEQFRLGNVPESLYSLRIHGKSVSANRKQTKRISSGVTRHCADLRHNKGVDGFHTPFGGKPKLKPNADIRTIRSYRMLLSLPEHKGLIQVSKNLIMLALCLAWWPANRPAWDETWWVLKHAARAVVRVI